MKVEDIKKIPKEFDFKSNINPFDIVYHAKEISVGYKVTCDISDCSWNFSKEKMRRSLYNNDYTIIKK